MKILAPNEMDAASLRTNLSIGSQIHQIKIHNPLLLDPLKNPGVIYNSTPSVLQEASTFLCFLLSSLGRYKHDNRHNMEIANKIKWAQGKRTLPKDNKSKCIQQGLWLVGYFASVFASLLGRSFKLIEVLYILFFVGIGCGF